MLLKVCDLKRRGDSENLAPDLVHHTVFEYNVNMDMKDITNGQFAEGFLCVLSCPCVVLQSLLFYVLDLRKAHETAGWWLSFNEFSNLFYFWTKQLKNDYYPKENLPLVDKLQVYRKITDRNCSINLLIGHEGVFVPPPAGHKTITIRFTPQ